MGRFTNHCGIVAVGDNQSRFTWKKALFLQNECEVRRYRPEETIAKFEIIGPLAVADEIGLGDLDLDDRESPFAVDCHQIRPAPVGKREFANCEQILATEKASHAARYFCSERRTIDEAGGPRCHKPH